MAEQTQSLGHQLCHLYLRACNTFCRALPFPHLILLGERT